MEKWVKGTKLAHMKRAGVFLTLVGVLSWTGLPVFAQDLSQVWISAPQAEGFPNVVVFMEAYDNAGNFIADLNPDHIEIVEDSSETYRPTEMQLIQPGLQVITAFNIGPVMRNHSGGVSNFDAIRQHIQGWAEAQPVNTPDDFSLATSTGIHSTRLVRTRDWVEALGSYEPDLENLQPSLTSLAQALDLAANAELEPNMKQVILYISPTLTNNLIDPFPDLIERAAQLDVTVFVWMVATTAAADSPSAALFQELTQRTGGQYFLFSGPEQLPDLESYLQPMRYTYRLGYNSSASESGSHKLLVRIKRDENEISSQAEVFSINIQPPNPMFLAPPTEIERSWVSGVEDELILTPSQVTLNIMIEYPDGMQRDLGNARLYVDGELMDENFAAPFEQFEWDLNGFDQSQIHMLHVEVEDNLGLKAASIEIPIEIMIADKPADGIFAPQRLVIGAAIFVAALALISVVALAGRNISPLQRRLNKRRQYSDPVTQPVHSRIESPTRPLPNRASQTPTVPLPRRNAEPPAPARLVFISESGHPVSRNNIPIDKPEITLGSDPQQAMRIIKGTSVSSLHARLYRSSDNNFYLADAGSTSGTWVNYAPVSASGARLENGDLVHIGRLAFRFELTSISPPSQPLSSLQE